MRVFIKQKDESRKEYLVRVAIYMLREYGDSIDNVIFDEAECDSFCLADDLMIEFNTKQLKQ